MILQVRFAATFSALVLAAATLTPSAARAQLYTWKDAQGNITIRNTPPPWYDDSGWTRGPRVQVLREKKVIDDTAWPATKRQDARNKATAEEIKRMQSAPPASAGAKGAKDDDE